MRNHKKRQSEIARAESFIERTLKMFQGHDDIKPTEDCSHCHGTGVGPSSDGRTECGFCTGEQ